MSNKRPLDVLYVGTLPPHPGGSAISCTELLAALGSRGHSLRALGPITPGSIELGRRFDAGHPEMEVTRFVVPRFDVAPHSSSIPPPDEYRAVERAHLEREIPRLIAERRPDVVLVGRESFAWDVPALAKARSIPSVLMIRGGSRTARLLDGELPEDAARDFLERLREANRVVTVAEHLAQGLRRLGIANVQTIRNAVDSHRFAPRPKDPRLFAELGIADGDVVVVHVAHLQPRKGSPDLVASAARALRDEPRLLYVIVGEGPSRPAMEEACRRAGIERRFRYVGWVEYDRVPAYLSLADLVVAPSRHEGLARVYLETQACGRLLVASDIAPAREVVEDGETGLLFERGNVDDLAAQTVFAARRPEVRAAIGAAARCASLDRNLDGMVAEYESLLLECSKSLRATDDERRDQPAVRRRRELTRPRGTSRG